MELVVRQHLPSDIDFSSRLEDKLSSKIRKTLVSEELIFTLQVRATPLEYTPMREIMARSSLLIWLCIQLHGRSAMVALFRISGLSCKAILESENRKGWVGYILFIYDMMNFKIEPG